MHLKESAATFSPPPAPAARKPMTKSVVQVNQPAATTTDGPYSSSETIDNINDTEGMQLQSLLLLFQSIFFHYYLCWFLIVAFVKLPPAADGYSIYIKGLPMSATVALLADEFKKFGPIKNGGIQVRSNRVCLFVLFSCLLKKKSECVDFFCYMSLCINGFSNHKLVNGSNRDFVLDSWNLKWKVLCKKQSRYLIFIPLACHVF